LTHQTSRQKGERGNVMIMTAILMLGLVFAMGLCIDVARIYMVRTELQNAADAASLAAARELDSGTGGIQNAVTRATNIVNDYGFNRAAVTIAPASVKFAVNLDGPYWPQGSDTDANAANIKFVQVTTQSAATTILFAIRALGNSHTESRTATAGMSAPINTICDFFPIAVALKKGDYTGADGYPAPNTTMSLSFVQGTGNSATLADKNYIILEVPDISGNGSPETAVLSAGLTSICQTLNASIQFHMTPSANVNNGPRQITDGINTRFNLYAGGYGNALQPSTYPPDSNIQQNITFLQYDNPTLYPTAVTAPNPNGPGQEQRRILIVPIVDPNGPLPLLPTYSPPVTQIKKWAAFFLKDESVVTNPCNKNTAQCGELHVEWIDEKLVLGRGGFDPAGGCTSFSVPVLYK
jgi:Flp pilus assembly protein TadG